MNRVVITGMGAIAPNAVDAPGYWKASLDGLNGIGRLERFDPARYPARLAGEIRDFDPQAHLPNRLLTQTDHVTRLSLAVAAQAVADGAVTAEDYDSARAGVVTASTAGGFEFGQRELQKLWSLGGEHVSAYQSFAWFYAVNTGQISIRHGMRGSSGVLVADHAGGLDALGEARRRLRRDSAMVVAGAVDGSLCPWGWAGQLASGQLSTAEDPTTAYLPFDRRAGGWVPGEGGALLVLEHEDRARARRAPAIHGVLSGYAATFDPPAGRGRPPTLRRAVEAALDDAGLAPSDIGVVFADAAGVPAADEVEASALRAVFGPGGVPVTAPKTLTGRLGAGAGPLDVVAALYALREQCVPPTAHVRARPDYDLDLVTGVARPVLMRHALILARGIGGFNAAVVLSAA
ncbi:ketosynthase chain-length factor [Micromonospora sp. PTRAS2]